MNTLWLFFSSETWKLIELNYSEIQEHVYPSFCNHGEVWKCNDILPKVNVAFGEFIYN